VGEPCTPLQGSLTAAAGLIPPAFTSVISSLVQPAANFTKTDGSISYPSDMKARFLVATIVAGVMCLPVSAGTVIWDEAVNGDLSGLGTSIGNFQVGTNTFLGSGSLLRSGGNAASADTDSGFLVLNDGLRIDSMTAFITSLFESPGSTLFTRFAGLHSPTTPTIVEIEMISNATLISLLPDDTLGTYRFFTGGGSAGVADDATILWDWRIDIVVSTVPEPVTIDIQPHNDHNSINCNNDQKAITVAILTTEDFDTTSVDHTTVTFEGATESHVNKKSGEPKRHEEDVDGDGDIDQVFHFRLGDTDLDCSSTEGTLTGLTIGSISIEGTDEINMVGGTTVITVGQPIP